MPAGTGGPLPYLPAFESLGAEFTAVWSLPRIWNIHIRYTPTKSQVPGLRTLLLVSQKMGFALELLATLIAGRWALSLHFVRTILVEHQLRREVTLLAE
jgi:hypothetical protein